MGNLPDRYWLTLSEALTWLETGEARTARAESGPYSSRGIAGLARLTAALAALAPAPQWHEAGERARCEDMLAEIQLSIALDDAKWRAAELLLFGEAGAGRVEVFGVVAGGAEYERVPLVAFDPPAPRAARGEDVLRAGPAPDYPSRFSMRGAPAEWRRVRLRRREVARLRSAPDAGPGSSSPSGEAPRPWPLVTLADLPAHWTLIEAVAWIMLRDPEVVVGASLDVSPAPARPDWSVDCGWPLTDLGLTLLWAARGGADGRAPGPGWDHACSALLAKLRAGAFTCRGRRADKAEAQDMSAADWRGLSISTACDDDRVLVAWPAGAAQAGVPTESPRWTELLVPAAAVVGEWPSPEAKSAEGVRPAPSPASASERRPAAERPKPSDRALREWFRERVRTWPPDAPFPSEAADFEAARAHFGEGLVREDFRSVRRDEAPEAWRKQGRRTNATRSRQTY